MIYVFDLSVRAFLRAYPAYKAYSDRLAPTSWFLAVDKIAGFRQLLCACKTAYDIV